MVPGGAGPGRAGGRGRIRLDAAAPASARVTAAAALITNPGVPGDSAAAPRLV